MLAVPRCDVGVVIGLISKSHRLCIIYLLLFLFLFLCILAETSLGQAGKITFDAVVYVDVVLCFRSRFFRVCSFSLRGGDAADCILSSKIVLINLV